MKVQRFIPSSSCARDCVRLGRLSTLFALLATIPVRPQLSAQNPAEPSLVAEGLIMAPDSAGVNFHAFLPVTIHGHVRTFAIDHGAPYNVLSRAVMDSLGVQLPHALMPEVEAGLLDSLVFGKTIQYDVPMVWVQSFVDRTMPSLAGLLGTPTLSHYDAEFDGLTYRYRLYGPLPLVSTAPSTPRRLPSGWAAADCVPMSAGRSVDSLAASALLQVDGQTVPMYFDSGSPITMMNMAAAKVLGLRKSSPQVRPIPRDSIAKLAFSGAEGKHYRVTGSTLHLGPHPLGSIPIQINPSLPGDNGEPLIALGLDAIRGRRLLVSYGTHKLCVRAPEPLQK